MKKIMLLCVLAVFLMSCSLVSTAVPTPERIIVIQTVVATAISTEIPIPTATVKPTEDSGLAFLEWSTRVSENCTDAMMNMIPVLQRYDGSYSWKTSMYKQVEYVEDACVNVGTSPTVPPKYIKVAQEEKSAHDDFGTSMYNLRKFLDTDNPIYMSEASDYMSQATAHIENATALLKSTGNY